MDLENSTDDKLKDSRILNQLNLMKKGNLDMSSGYMEDQMNILKYPKDKIGLILNIALGINQCTPISMFQKIMFNFSL